VDRDRFEDFVKDVEPRLRRALVGVFGADRGREAVAEALAYGWEHWDRVREMSNPAGYLYRVGQSRTRRRLRAFQRVDGLAEMPQFEPALVPALMQLPLTQRSAVWLVHACDWSYADTADALGMSATAVGTHVSRGLARLRELLKAEVDA
jgi:DNA-directed RNA polymerase specialized sigma24 family protein